MEKKFFQVYIFRKGLDFNDLVYVGTTKNFKKRISWHQGDKKRAFGGRQLEKKNINFENLQQAVLMENLTHENALFLGYHFLICFYFLFFRGSFDFIGQPIQPIQQKSRI